MILVTLSFPNEDSREVWLAGVPREGESVRIANGPGTTPTWYVEHVTWGEGKGNPREPTVTITVRENVRSKG